jgi:hypothetical protein
MSQPVPTWRKDPESTWGSLEGVWDMDENVVFSFWNALAPEKEKWADYFTSANSDAPADNWYAWNNNQWGTKWDAKLDVDTLDQLDTSENADGTFSVTYHFETAWGAPYGVFQALTEKYPHLHLDISWEEEQGFGAELEATNGEITTTDEWDIPNSHADHVARDKEDSCACAWGDDEDEWYDDCPKSEEDENILKPVVDLTTVS